MKLERKETAHCRFLLHCIQNDLKGFSEKVLGLSASECGIKNDSEWFAESIEVEHLTKNSSEGSNRNRIDIYIEYPNLIVGIEVKIDAKEHKDQLENYCKYLEDEKTIKQNGFRIFFLTLNGRAPVSAGKWRKNVKSISFVESKEDKKSIIDWLTESKFKTAFLSTMIDNYCETLNIFFIRFA